MSLKDNKEGIDNNIETKKEEYSSDGKFGEFKTRKWLQYLLIVIAICISVFLVYKGVLFFKNGYSNMKESIENKNENINTSIFNNEFEFRRGNQNDTGVLALLDSVITNNKKDKEHVIKVIYEKYDTSDTDEIRKIKSEITPNKKYEVTLDYDSNNYVNIVTISGTIDKNSIELKSFNSEYEMYSGTKMGAALSVLLDNIITNNRSNDKHLIEVIYGNHNTTDSNEITNMKKEFDDWTNYEVSLDYDSEGYVNKIIIS